MKIHELIEHVAEASGWPTETRHRGRLLREARIFPAGKPGPGGGVEATPEHAARLLASILYTGSALDARGAVEHFEQTQAARIQLLCDRELMLGCAGQLVAQDAIDGAHIINGEVQSAESVDHSVASEVFVAHGGWLDLLPAGSFLDVIAHLIRSAGDPDSGVPWLAVRCIGVTQSADAIVGWIEFNAAVDATRLRYGDGQQRFLFAQHNLATPTGPFRALYVKPSDLGGVLLGRSHRRETRIGVKLLFEIGKALTGESGATNANGSTGATVEPLEVRRTAAPTAEHVHGTVDVEPTTEAEPEQSDSRRQRRTSSLPGGKPEKDRGSHERQRGGGAAQRRNAAQTG